MTRTALRPLLAASVATMMLSGAAFAQTTTPTPSTTAPAARTQAQQTTLAPNEVTSTRIVGAAIYAPKTTGSAAQTRAGDPTTTGSMAFPTVSDADWTAMKNNHDHIGEVNNLVVATDGRIQHVVLGVGGFLGIGEKSVAVRFSDVRWMTDSDGKVFGVVVRTRQELEAAPRFVDRS